METKFARYLVDHCAPTLAGLKVGNLFRYTSKNSIYIRQMVRYWNKRLIKKGICVRLIKQGENDGLIYVFRPAMLERVLSCQEIHGFLNGLGFDGCQNSDSYICKLCSHMRNQDGFPHEIGIFLGYPLQDVKSFIENKGQGFSLCGFWKVYHNPSQAEKLFEQYRKCTDIYKSLFANGNSILQLTVAA